MMGVRDALARLATCLRYWPQLAAAYLLGLLIREGTIELAAWAGHDHDVWASLIMPLAGLARLGSFVAMFLLLRPAFPELAPDSTRPRRQVNLMASVIVPLVAIYLAWRMFAEDWLAFERRALPYRVGEAVTSAVPTELHPDTLPVGTSTLIIIGGALAARLALNRIDDRLPRWMLAVRVYVDFLWVFLVLTFSVNKGLTFLTNPAGWVKERRFVVWLDHIRSAITGHFHLVQAGWDAAAAALRVVFGGALMPLLWLAVAGIIYDVSAQGEWSGAARRIAGRWADTALARTADRRQRLKQRWKALPRNVRDESRKEAEARIGKLRPVADSARTIAHAGALGLAVYVLAYLALAWLDMSGSFYRTQNSPGYLFRGMAWIIGPHPIAFWNAVDGPLILLSHLLIEPLRIALVATTFAYCVQHMRADSEDNAKQDGVRADDVDRGRRGPGGHFEGQLQ